MRKIREMMESCSHTEYRQSFYLTLHSEGLLFHGPPYLILLLPPRLPLLLVRKPLLGNLAVEKRRRVKTQASGYHESLGTTGIWSCQPGSPCHLGTAHPWPVPAASTNPPGTGGMAMARPGAKEDRLEAQPAALSSCLHAPAGTRSACSTNNQGILLRAYWQVIITCWSTDKAGMEQMRRSSCQDHKFAGIKQKKFSGMWFKKERRKEGKRERRKEVKKERSKERKKERKEKTLDSKPAADQGAL